MTVNYSLETATAKWNLIFKLGLKWKGSIWKLVLWETLVWLICTLILMFTFHFAVVGHPIEKDFKRFADYVTRNDLKVAMAFILAFSSAYCFNRWIDMYGLLHWPDDVAHSFNATVNDSALPPAEMLKLRSCVARYLIFGYILLLRDVSVKIRKRFPTLEHLTHYGGIITGEEKELLDIGRIGPENPHYWIPFEWIVTVVKKYYIPEQKEGFITGKARKIKKKQSIMSEKHYTEFVTTLFKLRGHLGDILSFDWVPMPLALTQVMTLVIITCAITQMFQAVHNGFQLGNFFEFSSFVGLFYTTFQMMIYVGWVKSFQVIENPFGEDDDDFEVNQLIDRHWQSLIRLLLDPLSAPPEIPKKLLSTTVPHTIASRAFMKGRDTTQMIGSLADAGQLSVPNMLAGHNL
ncbi:unnamed protein product, partial [Mesorhabditis belari]|uniref:Bestrophin homolog n=1 Tax=Mesorhabditis belari TaxID=2138241 RepID=A0AAF3FCB0_9BILA